MRRRGPGLVAALLAALGCGAEEAPTECRDDSGCPAAQGCHAGTCVPRPTSAQAWAVEVTPRAESTWAPTEFSAVAFGAAPVTLRAERRVMVSGTIEREETEAEATVATARAVLALASEIGDRERTFEAQAATRLARGPLELTFAVSESALGRQARLRVVPSPPLDRVMPPWTATMAALPTELKLAAPKATELYFVEGSLQTPLGDPERNYVARALVRDRLVSSVFRTDDAGRFRLRIPRQGMALEAVSIELAPAEPMSARPRLLVRGLSESRLILGALRLPPDSDRRQAYDIPVVAQGTSQRIPGITLRFQAPLPGATGAEAYFRREAQTDRNGVAHVQLVPGPLGQTREYTVAIIPPPGSEYAARCVRSYSVVTGPGTEARVGEAIALARKTELAGRVRTAGGAPAGGVTVTAVRRSEETYSPECDTTIASPPERQTTDREGSYRLLLDPGRYRISFEPPPGLGSPPLVQDDVAVERDARRDVTLAAGALAEGVVQGPAGEPIAGCDVRVLGVRGDGRTEVRGHARTDADGRFRLVLPQRP